MPRRFLLIAVFSLVLSVPMAVQAEYADFEHKKILVMGDSLSAAYRLPVEQGWVQMLQQHFDTQNSHVSIVNASVSGITTAGGLKVLPKALQEHQPDFVILELGANDGLQGKPLPYIKANLARLIELARAANTQILLLGVRLPPNYGAAYTEPFFSQYKELSQHYEVDLLPFFLDGVAGKPELMFEDGKHPNAEGQKLVLKNVLPAVEHLLGAEQKNI